MQLLKEPQMSDHLRMYTSNPINGAKTEFVLWHTPDEQCGDELVGRCVFNIDTGNATIHTAPNARECRALAAHLLAMADAIEADKTVFQPKGE
jgi:hypothetical protein